ncbi:ribosome maturation factor RimM [Mammaliicoccus stepanovicii]|uniref:Ribosome maturation factor RimM n=1 Tax=Mammaliicoccus stepanovicii TaxID=643214 RepID=A0A239ZHF1_9STAP|nr:ribosome maturation factor RimM [Mammaliicoccus stepanovicii]PNZ77985.1 ribosome maturation factor RimM [Mammaliicoccus stepanovicii]GGI41761.1 ribosome maturation factor RimM [Mammaliicoccus stepanovicii]SNV70662.1 16S rRNA-processing protein RimM [Mammaliicoccus stepanovicii]
MKVEVGKFVNTHGIKGEIRVLSDSDFTDERFQVGQQIIVKHKNEEQSFTIASHRLHKNFHLLTFEGIHNINDIEYLKGSKLFQEEDNKSIELEENEFYYADIIGCTVYVNDEQLGKVTEVMETGANDVWVVQGDKEYLIPYIEDVVKKVQIENKSIYIEPMEGLLD